MTHPTTPPARPPLLRLTYTTRTGRVTFDETAEPLMLLSLLAARVKGWEVAQGADHD